MTAPGTAASAAAQDISALQAALAAEHAANYGYGVVGAHLSGRDAAQAGADWVAHQRARDELAAAVTAAGAKPVPAAVAYQLPGPVSSAAQAKRLAVHLEDMVARAYIGLVGVTDLRLRAVGARQLTAAALRATAWSHATTAFPGLAVHGGPIARSAPAISQPG